MNKKLAFADASIIIGIVFIVVSFLIVLVTLPDTTPIPTVIFIIFFAVGFTLLSSGVRHFFQKPENKEPSHD